MSGIDTDEHDIEPSTSGCRYVFMILNFVIPPGGGSFILLINAKMLAF